MTRISLTETAQQIIGRSLANGHTAIDATVGNGHDTLFLADVVGAHGRVFGFDIQKRALSMTRQRLQDYQAPARVNLFQVSHSEMVDTIPNRYHGKIQAIMFNLGYLPGSDKSVITRPASTLTALTQACQLLAPGGTMTVLTYSGHAGGEREALDVYQWLNRLDPADFACSAYPSREKKGMPRLFHLLKRDAGQPAELPETGRNEPALPCGNPV